MSSQQLERSENSFSESNEEVITASEIFRLRQEANEAEEKKRIPRGRPSKPGVFAVSSLSEESSTHPKEYEPSRIGAKQSVAAHMAASLVVDSSSEELKPGTCQTSSKLYKDGMSHSWRNNKSQQNIRNSSASFRSDVNEGVCQGDETSMGNVTHNSRQQAAGIAMSPSTAEAHFASPASLPGAYAQKPTQLENELERRSSAVEEVLAALEQQQRASMSATSPSRRASLRDLLTKRPTEHLVEAKAVADAEAVYEAEEVQRDFFRRNQVLIAMSCLLACVVLVTLLVVLTRRDDSVVPSLFGRQNRTGDPRCWVPSEELPLPLRCYCDNTTGSFYDDELSPSEIFLYRAHLSMFDRIGFADTDEIENYTSCHPANIIALMGGNLDQFNITYERAMSAPERVRIYLYTLMYLYLLMGGIDWEQQADEWGTTQQICEWTGIDCLFIDVLHKVALPSVGLRGKIPSEIRFLGALRFLDFSGNPLLTGTIPSALAHIRPLMSLDVSESSMTGTIPSELGLLRQLDSLQLSSNRFTGTIPPQLFSGPGNSGSAVSVTIGSADGGINDNETSLFRTEYTLRSIGFSNNLLVGRLPSEMGLLTRLVWVRLQSNQLTGDLPTELGSLTNLEMMNIGNNTFRGTIPTLLGRLPRLEMLNLYKSGFTGSIPESFCDETRGARAPTAANRQLLRQIVVDCHETYLCSCCNKIGSGVEIVCGESLPDFNPGLNS